MTINASNDINMNGRWITNVGDPGNAQDAATKNYVDTVARGLDWHPHVRVLVSSNVNTASPGATLDGVTMAANDRILLTGQTTGSQNGLWVWNAAASALTRPTDYAASAVFTKGSVTVTVTEGSQDDTVWTMVTDGTVTVNTTTTTWVLVGGTGNYLNEFNVRYYGALGDGSNNDSTAFQATATAAMSYVATNGGRATIRIPSGSYKLNTTMIVSGGNITVNAYGAYIFAGSNNDLVRDWTTQDSSYTLNGRGLTILGGTWDLKGQNWGLQSNGTMDASGFSGFTLSNSSDILFRDVTIRNVYDYHGIDINTCDGVTMENVRIEGFQNNGTWHTACRLASTANLTLTGAATIDGVAVATSDRILVKNQTTTSQNGIYVANTAGAWTRATDMDAAGEALNAAVNVTAGTVGAGTSWYVSSNNPTPGSAAMVWAQYTPSGSGGFNYQSRYFSEAIQLDDGPNDIPSKDITAQNCWMGPASDGSGLGAFGKLIGSHTDSTNGLYTNIKVMGCTSVASLSNAIQGYSWADATISDNTILGSSERGIRMTFNASNVGPRLSITGNMISNTVLHGIEVDGSTGSFGDVNISNNVITSTVMATPGTGIRINVIDRVTVSNNSIQLSGSPSSQQGIYLLTINGGVVSNNSIYNPGTYGIQTTALSRVSFTGNHVYAAGSDGIYFTGSTNKCIASGNSIVGCGRTTNATYSGITVSNNVNNVDNSIIGNKFNKFGSGNEMLSPIELEGAATDTYIIGNTFGGDWGGPGLGNYTWNNNTSVNLDDAEFTASATGTTSIALTATAIAGLSISNIPAGTWQVYAWIPAVIVGTPTGMTMTVSPSSGPTITSGYFEGRANRTGFASAIAQTSTFNSAMSLGALSAVATNFELVGTFTSTNTGTVSISMTRTSGTSCTTQIGAYLKIMRQQ